MLRATSATVAVEGSARRRAARARFRRRNKRYRVGLTPRTSAQAGVDLNAFDSLIAEEFQAVAAFDQRDAFGGQTLEFDRSRLDVASVSDRTSDPFCSRLLLRCACSLSSSWRSIRSAAR